MKQHTKDHVSHDQSVNNGRAGNPAVNQNPTKDGDVQEQRATGRPDKTINDTTGKDQKRNQKKS